MHTPSITESFGGSFKAHYDLAGATPPGELTFTMRNNEATSNSLAVGNLYGAARHIVVARLIHKAAANPERTTCDFINWRLTEPHEREMTTRTFAAADLDNGMPLWPRKQKTYPLSTIAVCGLFGRLAQTTPDMQTVTQTIHDWAQTEAYNPDKTADFRDALSYVVISAIAKKTFTGPEADNLIDVLGDMKQTAWGAAVSATLTHAAYIVVEGILDARKNREILAMDPAVAKAAHGVFKARKLVN